MTWDELATRIADMTSEQLSQPIVVIEDLDGPKRRYYYPTLVQAREDIYVGISIGNELVVLCGCFYLSE